MLSLCGTSLNSQTMQLVRYYDSCSMCEVLSVWRSQGKYPNARWPERRAHSCCPEAEIADVLEPQLDKVMKWKKVKDVFSSQMTSCVWLRHHSLISIKLDSKNIGDCTWRDNRKYWFIVFTPIYVWIGPEICQGSYTRIHRKI